MAIIELSNAQLMTFVMAGDPPQVIDVAVTMRHLEPGDPREPGDVIIYDPDLNRELLVTQLRAAADWLEAAE